MKVGKKIKHSKKEHESFVSPETEQHVAVPLDDRNAVVNEGSLAGDSGRIEGSGETNFDAAETQFDRKHEVAEEVGQGEYPNRTVKKSSVGERHVTSEPGLKTAARRSAYVKSVRAQREKENFGKK